MEIIETPYLLEEKSKHINKLLKLENVFIANIQLKKGEIVAEHDSKKKSSLLFEEVQFHLM